MSFGAGCICKGLPCGRRSTDPILTYSFFLGGLPGLLLEMMTVRGWIFRRVIFRVFYLECYLQRAHFAAQIVGCAC